MSDSDFDLSSSLGQDNNVERQKQMSALVTKKLTVMEQKQWRIKTLSGKPIIVREQIDRIVKIVLVAKDFGSSLANMDPIHAGLECACCFLQVD